jgi:hypothetical protein
VKPQEQIKPLERIKALELEHSDKLFGRIDEELSRIEKATLPHGISVDRLQVLILLLKASVAYEHVEKHL